MKRIMVFILAVLMIFGSCRKNEGLPVETGVINLDTANLRIIQSDIPPAPYSDLTFTDEKTGYAVSRNSRIMKTLDSGVNWKEMKSPVNGLLKMVQFTTPETGFILGWNNEGAFILKTINAGINWKKRNLAGWGATVPAGMYFLNNSTGFICGGKHFLKTEDGGQTWQPVFSDDTGPYHDVRFRNNIEGYLTTGNNFYYATSDGGKSWKAVNTNDTLYNIYFSPGNAYAVISKTNELKNLKTSNKTLLPGPMQRLLFIDGKKCIGIGQHYEEGFWPYGDVFLTNDYWNHSQHKKYIQSEAIEVTAISRMSKNKTMMIGNAPERSIVVVLSHPEK